MIISRHTPSPSLLLINWYKNSKRFFPWRENIIPYWVFVSEYMLQQTQSKQMTPYFERFIKCFPNFKALAMADIQKVLKMWEGLGYYRRAYYLHNSAKIIVEKYDGSIPNDYERIIALPGVGPYTAAALLSLIYKLPYPVIDGNVKRVITRYYGIDEPISKQSCIKKILDKLNNIISHKHPNIFNQAIMELGATICKPKSPLCSICPLNTSCYAFNEDKIETFPVVNKKSAIPHYHVCVGVLLDKQKRILVCQRPLNSMLGGLWEFPGGKQKPNESYQDTVKRELEEELTINVNVIKHLVDINHAYTHFKISLHAYWCSIIKGTPKPMVAIDMKWLPYQDLRTIPFPKASIKVIDSIQTYLFNKDPFHIP